ncbi:hypothetical protein OG782_37585 (plasmid) [Streptomyces sp. NBC_00876]|uniref:hypothetical protein n=1 Tax=Streptomyces sp. NBC_00876 TaxID=2975853 RepID=UPI002F90F82E|nr:hypothetical protein OG782_37585 [Streptomyces sp. NBC_00876]
MTLTRPAPVTAPSTPPASRKEPLQAAARTYAELPPPVDAALRAMRLDALLGDPADAANPYGRAALADRVRAGRLPVPGALHDEFVPRTDGGHFTTAEQLARALRPLFRRDLALSQAWGVRPLLVADDGTGCAPARAGELAALLGPAALIAVTGTVLRDAVRVVDARGRHEPAVRQWHGTLAEAFADLLACESLVAVALRSLELPDAEAAPALIAAVGYVVPLVAADVRNALDLVLHETGSGPGSPRARALDKITEDLALAAVDWVASTVSQVKLVRELTELTDAVPDGRSPDPEGAGARTLFRLGEPVAPGIPAAECHRALAAALPAAAARLADAGDPAHVALARAARRLTTEQRTLRQPLRRAAHADPADPSVRALADRQALLLLAAAVLGVREAAADAPGTCIGTPDWALLALVRVTERLDVPLPTGLADPRDNVWAVLAHRVRHHVDVDVYATRLLW